jgi:hypothetical protein
LDEFNIVACGRDVIGVGIDVLLNGVGNLTYVKGVFIFDSNISAFDYPFIAFFDYFKEEPVGIDFSRFFNYKLAVALFDFYISVARKEILNASYC